MRTLRHAAAVATTALVVGLATQAAPALAQPATDAVFDAFTKARKAMLENDLDRYNQASREIPKEHPLYRYVEYWRLRILLSDKRPEALNAEADPEVEAFLRRHPESIAADLLRRDWMLALGRREDWARFDVQYPQWLLKDEPGPDCYAQMSLLAAGRPDLKASLALVMRPVDLPRPCGSLFRALADAGKLTPLQIRQRLRLAIEANAVGDIRAAAPLAGMALEQDKLESVLRKPAAALQAGLDGEMRIIALGRLARTDPEEAAKWLDAYGARLVPGDRQFAWSQVAAAGMRKLMPESHGWTRKAVGATYGEETAAWLIRAALRELDWKLVRQLVLALPASARDEPWSRYWLARAHAALGETAKAKPLFAGLANRHDFYGKLAREDLGEPWLVPAAVAEPPAEAIGAFDGNAGFARARAFYALGMRFEGNREWNFELRGLEPAQLRAAAHWARRQGLLDRAINTDERIAQDADMSLRFPAPFVDRLQPIAQAQGLDPAWVYGLIRQESRFILDARSHVGASGLMQLMPATARWVANKMGRTGFRQEHINDLQTNLEFGSFYLKNVLDDVDGSPVLASAGYNAGPRRARAWRAALERPVEGAIFAEIIPFAETRGYVKHVMSNAADYAGLMTGQPQSLKRWLGTIEPRPAGATTLP